MILYTGCTLTAVSRHFATAAKFVVRPLVPDERVIVRTPTGDSVSPVGKTDITLQLQLMIDVDGITVTGSAVLR